MLPVTVTRYIFTVENTTIKLLWLVDLVVARTNTEHEVPDSIPGTDEVFWVSVRKFLVAARSL